VRAARLAVDAANLSRDRRGMGRLARAVLRAAQTDPSLEIVLLASGSEARELRAEFPGARIAAPRTARRPGRYDVAWFPFNGMRFAVAAPSLVTIHDAFAFTEAHRERVARYREQAPIRRAARDATRILTDSAWSRGEIARELRVPPERIVVVRPEPDMFWQPGSGDALPAALEGADFALVVGVREPRKNALVAIEACARAFRSPRETLVIVGELPAPLRARAQALHLNCGEIVASDAMLRALYRRARVVLVPSTAEGFGLVAVEALACGAAVLAANAGALPEATGGAALLLDPHDVDAWTRAIRELFDDGARVAALQAAARARFAERDRDAAAAAVLALLRDLAAAA
jgi:glycosyltransferase involved in cell wall biosynthesis